MSEFTGDGFVSFPNLHGDKEDIHSVAEWSDEKLEYKTNQYGVFIQREDIMPRGRALGNWILDYCIFELAYRDGVYNVYTSDIQKMEDEVCGNT